MKCWEREKLKRVIYYSDEQLDDFAGTNIAQKNVGKGFPFLREGLLWRILSFFAYYIVAMPLAFIITKVWLGLRLENLRSLRGIRGGFFLYGNHTRDLDALIPALCAFPRRAYVVANPDAVSIPGLRNIVLLLGCIPIPNDREAMPEFMEAVRRRGQEGGCIAIFPEAHVWPFYTGIRRFGPVSFHYPAREGLPAVAMCTRYRRRLFGLLPPAMTVTFSEPMEPDMSLPLPKRKEELRDRVYSFMCRKSSEPGNEEWIKYVYKDPDEVL